MSWYRHDPKDAPSQIDRVAVGNGSRSLPRTGVKHRGVEGRRRRPAETLGCHLSRQLLMGKAALIGTRVRRVAREDGRSSSAVAGARRANGTVTWAGAGAFDSCGGDAGITGAASRSPIRLSSSSSDTGATAEVNVVAAARLHGLVRTRRRAGTLDPVVLVTGSAEQYGKHDDAELQLAETAEQRPHTVYAATNAFTLVFGDALWSELKPQGVDVLVVQPGSTRTPGWLSSQPSEPGAEIMPAMDPADVVREALATLGVEPRVIPGDANKQGAELLNQIPRRQAVELMSEITAKLVRNDKPRAGLPIMHFSFDAAHAWGESGATFRRPLKRSASATSGDACGSVGEPWAVFWRGQVVPRRRQPPLPSLLPSGSCPRPST
jgi:NAD(P)-dependent dehydrogenase (short-subunit alcohol dehydrogenase family)